MFLGHEASARKAVPVYAMPRMAGFLRANGPWDQLVSYENIALRPLADGASRPPQRAADGHASAVPHRQEYAEVVGFRIEGPNASVLFIPDID